MTHHVLVAIVGSAWVALIIVWVFFALSVKPANKHAGRRTWAFGIFWRVALVVAIIVAIRVPRLRTLVVPRLRTLVRWSFLPTLQVLGVTLALLGIGIALWARARLGPNWGFPQTVKRGHELVTTGPYAFVRHPIYAGILLALFGTSFVLGPPCFIIFAGGCVAFVHSALVEERLMRERFPDTYPVYMARTKRFIPFVW